MGRFLGIIAILVGAVLIILGLTATQMPGEKVKGATTGHFTKKTVWYLVGGVALVGGGIGLFRMKQ